MRKVLFELALKRAVRSPIHLNAAGELYLHEVLSESELCQKILPLLDRYSFTS
jgi:hypothetical protein